MITKSLKNITESGQKITITANYTTITISFHHNIEDNNWFIDVYDSEDNYLLSTKAVCNYDLFARYRGNIDGLPIAVIQFLSDDPEKECITGEDMKNEIVELAVLLPDEL